jgi:hypothetical protein
MIKYKFSIVFLFYVVLRELVSLYFFRLSYRTDSTWMLQFLSLNDLNKGPFNLFYLHNQPPVWNLLYWLSFQLFGSNLLLILINKASTYFSVWLMHLLLSPYVNSKSKSFLLALFFGMLPELFYYELWDYSSNFTMFLILLNAYYFRRVLLNLHLSYRRYLLLFSLSLSLLSLTRQTYDVMIICVIFVFFFGVILRINTKLLLVTIFITVSPAVAWKLKNKVLFDKFTMSSWAPMNLYRMASLRLTNDELTNLENDSFADIVSIGPFKSIEEYIKINDNISNSSLRIDSSKVPFCNFGSNSITYLNLSDEFGNRARELLLMYPRGYLLALVQSWALYFNPTSDYSVLNYNSSSFKAYKAMVNRYFYLQPFEESFGNKNWKKRVFSRSFLSIGVFIYVISISISILFKRRKSIDEVFLLYITSFILINSLSNFFDSGENMRFRYDVNALYIFSLYLIGLRLWRRLKMFVRGNYEKNT